MSYRVVIPTAGIGSRLEKLTKYLNKSLVSLANRPILSHLIDQFPKTCDFVIALGYKGDLVKDFLELSYPNRTFQFVNVKPYEGKGSGLGYTLLCCKKYLQEPFVFISCDTLVKEPIPKPKFNWMGYAIKKKIFSYRTLQIKENKITQINEKNISLLEKQSPYIGLAGIYDHKIFWNEMEKGRQIAIQQGEVFGLRKILKRGTVQSLKFTWFDTGTLEGLAETRKLYKNLKADIIDHGSNYLYLSDCRINGNIHIPPAYNIVNCALKHLYNELGHLPPFHLPPFLTRLTFGKTHTPAPPEWHIQLKAKLHLKYKTDFVHCLTQMKLFASYFKQGNTDLTIPFQFGNNLGRLREIINKPDFTIFCKEEVERLFLAQDWIGLDESIDTIQKRFQIGYDPSILEMVN